MKEVKEWIKSFLFALAIVIPISIFCRPTVVRGSSMQPTLYDRNIVVTQKNIGSLKHGEVVIFDARPIDDELYIKRVIGLPGETVEIKGGFVYVNNKKLDEPYLESDTRTDPDMKVIVPKGEVFVLGDNRLVSQDSRVIGTIPIKKIKGHAYFRVFPFNKMGKF
ncbi:MAG: signal peptidase I [Clostridiales bacterium]|nr:signal peptidase I [Clostridiales bacterium]HBM79488.1 signal peptidase I [Clostridiaceae bacterium]